ncbi:MAG: polyprenyl synthetase family protein [Acidobacteriota bacterium]
MHVDEASQIRRGRRVVARTYEAAVATEAHLTPSDLLALVAEPLARVEVEFQRSLDSDVGIIAEIGQYIARSGGKRLRPALVLLAARACEYDGDKDILYASVFEFIHTATLVHDDVIDGAMLRRGQQSVNSRWGNTLTVLLGDYLYIRSLKLALRGEDLRVLDLLADVTLKMIEGELMQNNTKGRVDITEAEYLDILTRKTACLFSGCCRTGALLVSRDDWLDPMNEFGLALGIAFQLVDDLLDFTSEEAVLGKPVASDLREGKLTLPVIDLLSRRPSLLPTVQCIVDSPGESDAAYARLTAGLVEEGCLDRARDRAHAEAIRAREALACLPPSIYREALVALPDLLVSRTV